MKKLFSLLSFLLIAAGAWADYYTPASPYTQGDAVIYATVSTNEADANASSYEVGAFVDGVCIGNAKPMESQIYIIRARGNEDLVGKTIEFRAYNPSSDLEFALTPSQTITFQLTGTYGLPYQPVTLTLKAPTSYSLADIEVEVGKSVNLLDYLTMTPSDATLPLNLVWGFYEEPYDMVSVDGNIMTGVYTGSTYLYLRGENLTNLAWAKVNVVKYATAINIVTNSITVNVDDYTTLIAFMKNMSEIGEAYRLIPADASNRVYWELKNDGIIEQREPDYWYPAKGGTTQIRPYFINKSGTKVYPASNKWITVTVYVPVESIAFDVTRIYANVGDDIYQRLAKHVKFTPGDATDQNYTFSTTATNRLTISGTSAVVKSAGSGSITVTSADGAKTGSVLFTFYNPLKEVTFSQSPLSIDRETSIADANNAIASNIVGALASNQDAKIELSGVLSGSGKFNPDKLWTVNITNTELQKGNATVSVTCGWYEYSTNDAGTDVRTMVWGTAKSFIVNIGVALNSMAMYVTPNTSDPTTGTIPLIPDPSDADINWADFPVSISDGNPLYPWNVVTLTDHGDGTFDYSVELPGRYVVEQTAADPQELEVPLKVSMASGWQWVSIPWGSVSAYEAFFGSNFAEARTWADLLINDPSWGLFGTLLKTSILQGEMFKLKMNGTKTSYLYDGIEDFEYDYNLQPGWNWIGCPFFYNRQLANAVNTSNLVSGTIIASKSDGSAEWNGTKWVGGLTTIKSGQGYLVYWPGSASGFFSFKSEFSMGKGTKDGASGAPRHVAYDSPWQYDHTLFASNMTMVATVEGILDTDRYTIGAFVNGECRGEGQFIDGLAFITVHGDGGENVSFRLHDTYTGDFFDIDQKVTSKTRLGSLDAPVRLSSKGFTDGISTIRVDNGTSGETFDANGRRLNGLQRGLNIIRQADGTVRKVVKK